MPIGQPIKVITEAEVGMDNENARELIYWDNKPHVILISQSKFIKIGDYGFELSSCLNAKKGSDIEVNNLPKLERRTTSLA